jgi:ABC-2 type transport system ATP-binding protein
MAIINGGKVLFAGAPDAALTDLDGKIWERAIAKSEMDFYQNTYQVISSKLVAGKPIIHVLSDTQPDGFVATEANLEDVFFAKIASTNL